MIDYSVIPNTQGGGFPNTEGKNISSPGVKDGTPWIKSFVDDIWGGNQALMDYASLTPSGSDETASSSQRLEAMKKCFGGPGEGVMYWGAIDPSSLPEPPRLLLCEGQFITISLYPELVQAVYPGDLYNSYVYGRGGAFWKTASPTGATGPDVNGLYMKIPDLRGYVPRGLDASGNVDPGGANRELGTIQGGGMQSHEHDLRSNVTDQTVILGFFNIFDTSTPAPPIPLVSYTFGVPVPAETFAATTNPVTNRFGKNVGTSQDETRGANVTCQFAIRY